MLQPSQTYVKKWPFLALPLAIGGPALNSVLPSTDFCEWLRYVWPTSDAEVNAVQEFFVAKVRGLHEVSITRFAN